MSNNTLPIGIFDSGVGGLTVYRALHDRLPNEHFIYLGDTARVPYGTKSLATVERYAIENSRFLASRGIQPVPFIYGSPRWVARKPNRPPLGSGRKVRAWRKFLAAVVKRYGYELRLARRR